MTFKTKLTLISVILIVLTLALTGFLGYRESKWKIKDLATDLVTSKTQQAYLLCEHYHRTSAQPSEELIQEIAKIRIASDGYIAVLSNDPDSTKGTLVIHPSSPGENIYNEHFPHIMQVIDEINAKGRTNGLSNFISYRQGTTARGRQGEKKIGYYQYFAPWNWVILATGYEKDVYASRDQLRKILFQIVAMVTIFGAAIVYFLIGQVVKPVQVLTASTREVARGNWDVSIEHHAKDEIGTLSKAFNNMVQSLRENARIWHEFNIAREMQAQMLPKAAPALSNLSIGAKSIPTKEVGGDFYDFLPLEDGRLGIVVGDVSGHGVSAAMVMTAAMGAVRFTAEEKSRTDLVLNKVNIRLSKDIQNHMFVALFYCIFNPKTYALHYTNAGQTMPYLLREGEISFLPQAANSDRFPLGIVYSASYEQLEMQLKPGDKLVIYTDGIVDAMNGNYESYGFERFADSIRMNAKVSPNQMIESLVGGMNGYSSDVHDDVTVVVLEVT